MDSSLLKFEHTFFVPGDILKTRWRSLRDCYAKFKRTIRTTTGQAAKKYKKWPWHEHMSFLESTNSLRVTSSNVEEPEEQNFVSEVNTESELTLESEPADIAQPVLGHRKKKQKIDDSFGLLNYFKERNAIGNLANVMR